MWSGPYDKGGLRMRVLTDKELDAVAGGDQPVTNLILSPQRAPFSVGVPNSAAQHENSPNLILIGLENSTIPLGASR